MTLTLRIENMASLPDGGPVEITSTGAPLRVGRKQGNDWVLPDPSNWISGFHFEVTQQGGAWFLTDRSSNGTFIVGQSYRLDGPYRLANGDRLQVGHYYIRVAIAAPAVAAPPPPQPAPPSPMSSGLTLAPFAAPAPPVAGTAPYAAGPGAAGLAAPPGLPDRGVPPAGHASPPAPGWGDAPAAGAPPGYRSPPPAVEEADPWAVGPAEPSPRPPAPVPGFTPPPFASPPLPPVAPPPVGFSPVSSDAQGAIGMPQAAPGMPQSAPVGVPRGDFGADFIVTPAALRQEGTPFPSGTPVPPPAAAPLPAGFERAAVLPPVAPPLPPPVAPAAAAPFAAPMPAPEAPVRPASAPPASGDVFLAAFCEGAGISPGALGGNMTEAFAHELGRTMRIVATELMAMLQDRATAKRFTRGGERTMISTENNNPLKFLPDSTQALEAMFLKPRAGFLKGGDAVSAGLADVRLHQAAVFAAIQPALARLLSDLAPEAIDEGGEGAGIFGAQNKKRLWDIYVERWDAKAAAHENGMLDVFLAHFAESYAAAVEAARRGQGGA